MSVSSRVVFVALVAVQTVFISGESSVHAQSSYRGSQSAPSVELPSATSEASMFPSTGDVVPPSIEGQAYGGVNEGYADQGYVDPGYSQGAIEPAPISEGPVVGEDYLTNNGMGNGMSYDAYGGMQDGPAPIYSTGSWWWRGNWYTQMDVMVLDRNDHRQVTLLNTGTATFLSENLARHSATPGARFTLGRFLGRDAASRDHMIEFAFMGLFDWSDGREVTRGPGVGTISSFLNIDGTNEIFSPFGLSDAQGFFYDSDLNDFQVNYRMQTRPGKDVMALQPNGMWVQHAVSSQVRSLLGGLRVASINEQADYTARTQGIVSQTDTIDGLTGLLTTDNIVNDDSAVNGRYLVRTHNDLFGFHLGGEVTEKFETWSWGLRGRVGGMINLVNRRSTVTSTLRDQNDGVGVEVRAQDDDGNDLFIDAADTTGMTSTTSPTSIDMTGATVDNAPLFNTVTQVTFDPRTVFVGESVSDETLSFVVETGVFGKYQLRPNLAFRAGYDFLLYTSLALAPENLGAPNGFDQLNHNGTALYHGGFAGFETTW